MPRATETKTPQPGNAELARLIEENEDLRSRLEQVAQLASAEEDDLADEDDDEDDDEEDEDEEEDEDQE